MCDNHQADEIAINVEWQMLCENYNAKSQFT